MSIMLTKGQKTPQISNKMKIKLKKQKQQFSSHTNKSKNVSGITVSAIISQCCKQQVTSSHMLTQCFVHEIIQEMSSIALLEKSQAKIDVINQIAFDLSSFITTLDLSPKSCQKTENDLKSYKSDESHIILSNLDLNQALDDLRRIDKSIISLLNEKDKIYDRLQLLNCSNQESSEVPHNEEIDDIQKMVKNKSIVPPLAHPVTQCNNNQTEAEKESSNLLQLETAEESDSEGDSSMAMNVLSSVQPPSGLSHFDDNVLNTAAICAKQKLSLPVKEEVDVHIENIDNITFKRFADVGASQMKFNGHTLICAASNGQIIRFCFSESIIPYLPHRTKTFDLCSSPVVDITMWNKCLIIASSNGIITKCSLRCKVLKEFSFDHEITAMAELGGVLYATSKTGFLNVINLRSMTLQRDPVELGHTVSMMKSSIFNSASLLVFLTDKCEIIGTSVVHGFIDSVIFKFALPNMIVFDIVQTHALPNLLTFFCGTPTSTSCLQLADNNLSQGSIIHHGTSAMIVHYNLLFLGSLNGDITIVNLKSNNTYCYKRIINGKITSFACHMSSLYIGTETSIYCMLIDNNDDIKIK